VKERKEKRERERDCKRGRETEREERKDRERDCKRGRETERDKKERERESPIRFEIVFKSDRFRESFHKVPMFLTVLTNIAI
jgi:hypothetical protein